MNILISKQHGDFNGWYARGNIDILSILINILLRGNRLKVTRLTSAWPDNPMHMRVSADFVFLFLFWTFDSVHGRPLWGGPPMY